MPSSLCLWRLPEFRPPNAKRIGLTALPAKGMKYHPPRSNSIRASASPLKRCTDMWVEGAGLRERQRPRPKGFAKPFQACCKAETNSRPNCSEFFLRHRSGPRLLAAPPCPELRRMKLNGSFRSKVSILRSRISRLLIAASLTGYRLD
jgi:hypothetical protein